MVHRLWNPQCESLGPWINTRLLSLSDLLLVLLSGVTVTDGVNYRNCEWDS